METKKKLSKEEKRAKALKFLRQSANSYKETNLILDQILPDNTQSSSTK